jgi:sulfotransferase
MKQFYFMSGLPRSGSTLISSILNQNPDIHASANSPMCGMMFNLERSVLASEQYSAYPKPKVMSSTISGVLENYYSDTDKPIVIDKSREWAIQEHFGVLLRNLPYEPKVIMPVRDITDILASFISLVNKNPGKPSFIDNEIQARQEFNFYRPIDDIRCDHLMRPKGLVDNAMYGLAYAMLEENRKYFHLVEYEDLLDNPKKAIDGIYEFLGVDKFDHDFDNIINTVKEDDKVYGVEGMHDVRSTISRRKIDKQEVLSPYVLNKYSNMEFWRNV